MSVKFVAKSAIIGVALGAGILVGTISFGLVEAKPSHYTAPTPTYQVNANGQTYGSDGGTYSPYPGPAPLAQEPDLILAQGTNGKIGYVKSSDLNGPMPKTPQQRCSVGQTE